MLSISDLVVQYGHFRAVDGLSLTVPKGALFGLLGPNGAGKTTTLHCVSGLHSLYQGTIQVDGLDPIRNPREVRKCIGLVPQKLALYDDLSVLDNLRTFAGLYGLRGRGLRDRVDWGMELSQLKDKSRANVSSLSGGMKRRLNMACSLLHNPSLIICDEPTTGVDPQSRNHLFETIRALNAEGRTIIYTTHYMEEVESLCDTVAIMDRGRCIAIDSLSALLSSSDEPTRFSLQFEDETTEHDVRAALEAAGINAAVSSQPRSLEDVFLTLTGRGLRDALGAEAEND